jgi:hypothetical protein
MDSVSDRPTQVQLIRVLCMNHIPFQEDTVRIQRSLCNYRRESRLHSGNTDRLLMFKAGFDDALWLAASTT